jgi:hypothetical protein
VFNSSTTALQSVRMRAGALAALTAAGLACSGAIATPSALAQTTASGAGTTASGAGTTTKPQPSPPPKTPYLVVTLNSVIIGG